MANIERFRINDYVPEGSAFHFARKLLPADEQTPLHDHDFYEMLLVESGTARHLINGSAAPLTEGDVVFLRPGDVHCFEPDDGTRCRIINIAFRINTAQALIARYPREFGERFFWTSGPLPAITHLVGAQLERAVNTSRTLDTTVQTQLRLDHFLLTMMTFVLDDVARLDPRAPDWLIRACHAAQNPDVFRAGASGFIAAAGKGPEHVSRQSKKYLGATPTEYINRIRIHHAAFLLRHESTALDAIAADCGFTNMSYFHRLFRLQYGCTPGTYRKRHRSPARSKSAADV